MISVIIPVYNAGSRLSELLKCLYSQSERDFEVLLINDGSMDGSDQICEEAAAADSRFSCIHQANKGVSSARNCGLQRARGEYITFLDADDKIDPEYFHSLLSLCREQRADVAVCDVIVERNGREVSRFACDKKSMTQKEALNYLLTRRQVNSGPCAKLYRRELIEGLVFPPLKAYEDILFVKEAFCRANRIAATSSTAYHYVENSQGAMGIFLRTPSRDIIEATGQLLSFLKGRPELDPECFYITASHLMQYVQSALPCQLEEQRRFVFESKELYQRHRRDILTCEAFPRKEKLLYLAFTYGWLYENKKIKRLR